MLRAESSVQSSIFERYADHEIGRELKAMSEWLDEQRDLLDCVAADVKRRNVEETGRKGLSVESVLRCAILKQYRQLSYEDLVFWLIDSASCHAFARLETGRSPKKATLEQGVSTTSDVTWEQINQRLLGSAKSVKVENGEMVRIDSAATDSPIHEPNDSTLLWDSVRVLVRLLKEPEDLEGANGVIRHRNHKRVAKKRMRAICYTRGLEKKARLYRDLIDVIRKTLTYVEQAGVVLGACGEVPPLGYAAWQGQVARYNAWTCSADCNAPESTGRAWSSDGQIAQGIALLEMRDFYGDFPRSGTEQDGYAVLRRRIERGSGLGSITRLEMRLYLAGHQPIHRT